MTTRTPEQLKLMRTEAYRAVKRAIVADGYCIGSWEARHSGSRISARGRTKAEAITNCALAVLAVWEE